MWKITERQRKGEEGNFGSEMDNKFLSCSYTPIHSDDNGNGVIGVASDINGHKLAEEELKTAMTLW